MKCACCLVQYVKDLRKGNWIFNAIQHVHNLILPQNPFGIQAKRLYIQILFENRTQCCFVKYVWLVISTLSLCYQSLMSTPCATFQWHFDVWISVLMQLGVA